MGFLQKAASVPVRSERILKAIEDSRSTNTRRQYKSAWKQWIAWCSQSGVQALPAAPQDVVEYLSIRAETKSKATLQVDRAAIAAAHRDAGYSDPTKDMSDILKGIKRQAQEGRGQAKALTHKTALAILQSENTSAKDKAIVGLLFFGGLRRSEAAALEWRDVVQEDGNVYVKVRKSKTNQYGEREDWRGPLKGEAAKAILSLAQNKDSRVLCLCGVSVARHLRNAALAVGVEGITGHSGRVGLATTLIEKGASTTEVAHAGGWQSDQMVVHYSRQVATKKGAVARLL